MFPSSQIASPTFVGPIDDDVALVKAAQKNLTAFTGLYQRHVTRVYRYLLAQVNNVHDAQDLTSQTFLTAMESLSRYRNDGPFAAWLLGIARHKAIDFGRRRRPQWQLELAPELADGQDSLEEVTGRTLQLEAVIRQLRTLAPDRAEALSLRLFGGLEVPEVARLLNKSEGAVRVLIHRGLLDLQSRLNVSLEEQE